MNKLSCEYCDRLLSNKRNLKRHIETAHLNIKPYKCEHCEFTSNQKHALMNRHSCYAKLKKEMNEDGETINEYMVDNYYNNYVLKYFFQ